MQPQQNPNFSYFLQENKSSSHFTFFGGVSLFIILLVPVIFLSSEISAQQPEYQFEFINNQSTGEYIVQDAQGMIWLSSDAELQVLSRYDGYQLTRFGKGEAAEIVEDPNFHHNYLSLYSDSLVLSVSYPTKSLLLFNPQSLEKEVISLDSLNVEGQLKHARFSKDLGLLLICQKDSTALVYLWNKNRIEQKIQTPNTHYNHINYTKIHANANQVWLSLSPGGNFHLDWEGNLLKKYSLEDYIGLKMYNGNPHNIFFENIQVHKNGDWFISLRFGQPSLYRYHPQRNQFEAVNPFPNMEFCLAPIEDEKGNILYRYGNFFFKNKALLRTTEGEWVDYSNYFQGFERRKPPIITKDLTKLIWIGGLKGLGKIEFKQRPVRHDVDEFSFTHSIELGKDSFLVGSDNEGLFLLDKKQLQSVSLPFLYQKGVVTPKGLTSRLIRDKKGAIWLNDQAYLYKLNKKLQAELYPLPATLNKAWTMLTSNELCLALSGQTIQLFDINQATFSKVSLPSHIQFSIVHTIEEGAEGSIYFGTDEGLIVWQRQSGTFQQFSTADGLCSKDIISIHEEEQDLVLLGTNQGMTHFNLSTKESKHFSKKDGLPENQVVGILPYKDTYWLATNNGVSHYMPAKQQFRNFSVADGFSHKVFNPNSIYLSSQGQLLFGSKQGLNIFHPKSFETVATPTLTITAIERYNELAGKMQSDYININPLKKITLAAQNKYLRLHLALSDLSEQATHRFAYRIKGLNKDWVQLGNQNQITINTLPEGNYELEIKGATKYSFWSAIQIIPLKVNAFFYETWWFYGLLLAIISSLVVAWIYRLRAEKIRLETLVTQRTAQIEADKIIIQAQADKLKSLDEVKTRFYTNITHEFRTPLTIILGMVNQIKAQPKVWLNQGMDMIQRNGDNLLRLINQMLDLQKLESGKLELDNIQGDIIVYLKYMLESFHSLAESKGVQIQFQSNQENHLMDYDPDKLLIIISNLLSNAIKFSNYGDTVILSGHILANNSKQEKLQIQVIDTGKGIPIEKLPHIFDRFYQVDGSSTRQGEGTGIGLALTKEMTQLMNGSITVESKLEHGTTFKVLLPISNLAQLQTNFPTIPKPIAEGSITTNLQRKEVSASNDQALVLVIEDNADVRTYLTACLRKDYELIYAENGAIGIESAKTKIPDIIISDVMMPIKDGFEVCETLKQSELTSHIPIILLTAKATIADRIAGLTYGADAYLAKPFQPAELKARLAQLIDNQQRLQKKYSTGILIDTPEVTTEDNYLHKIQQAILENLETTPFGPNELVRILGTSRTQLHRKLKALTKLSTSNYINKIRLQEAKKLLKTTDLSISEIAYSVGYATLAYFTASFSKEFKEAPSTFRES